MEGLTDEDHAVFQEEGISLYEEVVASGSIAEDDARFTESIRWKAAFDLLVRLGLLQRRGGEAHWSAVDPSTIQAHVVTPLSAEGTRLLEESTQWARDFTTLAQAWRRSPESDHSGPVSYLQDQQIISFISGLVTECEEEMLTAQPQDTRDTGGDLARALQTDSELLKRGAKMRTLYQHAARRSPVTREYVAAVTDLGAEVRTLDEFFNRMIVFDRRIAIIPSPDSFSTALAVREPTIVAYLVDVFERSWERARPFTSRDAALMKDIAVEQRAMTMRMLVEGHSDPSAAKRLGVSPRTYAGYVADLKREFDAETRFQLGYVLGQRGLSGNEQPDS